MSQNFSSKEETEYKSPDVILVDGDQEDFSRCREKREHRKSRGFTLNQRVISPRLFSFLGFIFSFLFGVLILVGSLPSLFFSALFLFRNQPLNLTVKRLWKLSTNALVVSAGFLLGVVAPPLGFGFILLYLSWHAGQDRFSQTIRRLFSA